MLKKTLFQTRYLIPVIIVGALILGVAGRGIALAGDRPDIILVAPQSIDKIPLKAGCDVRFFIVLTNGGTGAVPVPQRIKLTLGKESGETIDVYARTVNAGDAPTVPGKGFLKQAYQFILPVAMTGTLSMSAPDRNTNTAMFHADPAVATTEILAAGVGGPDLSPQQFQPFFVNFSSYKPVYFLFGMDPGIQKSSFQISFKYKLFNFEANSFGKQYLSGLENIRLAYTQQSFWDLKSDSAPFEDSRYMPELFYVHNSLGLDLPYLIQSGFQTGLQHESNGRDGERSRSTNYGYIQPFLAFKFTNHFYWKVAPKAWVYVRNEHESNGDIADYRGYFDIENKLGDPTGIVLENHFRHGRKGGTWQFDLSYPLNQIPWLKGFVDMYIHAQYFSGYSDQLLEYDQREDVIRLGFSLVR